MPKIRLIVAIAVITACSGPIGEQFADVDSIGVSGTWRDWVVVGQFGPAGPFRLTGISECDYSEPCTFSHDGQDHSYEGFYGYKLTILRLESPDGAVSHVVLRSKSKQYGGYQ